MDRMEVEEARSGLRDGDPLSSPNHPQRGKMNTVTCVQTVIQSNQQSVIQSATGNLQPSVVTKGNVILVSKPSSVIQTPQGNLQTLQVVVQGANTDDEDSLSPRHTLQLKRNMVRDVHNELQSIITKTESSGSDCDSNLDSELSSHSMSSSTNYQSLNVSHLTDDELNLSSQNDNPHHGALSTITMTTAANTTGGTILHYAGQDGQFFVPGELVVMQNTNNGENGNVAPEEQLKKREMRLLKNREAARECRRKKKEYIKCLENRVAVLETQNKALIDELKSLKELYCLQKTE